MRRRRWLLLGTAMVLAVGSIATAIAFSPTNRNLSRNLSTPADAGARVSLVRLEPAEFQPSHSESEAIARALDFARATWQVANLEDLPRKTAIGTFTGRREDTKQQVSDLKVWVVVFYDFPVQNLGPIPLPDPRLTVIVDDQSGRGIYAGVSWAPDSLPQK